MGYPGYPGPAEREPRGQADRYLFSDDDADDATAPPVTGGTVYGQDPPPPVLNTAPPTTGAVGGTAGPAPVRDVFLSYVRTWTPYLVATLITWLAVHYNVVIGSGISENAVIWIVLGLGSAYYAVARALERAKSPALRTVGRWLLGGVIRQPVYTLPPVGGATLIEPDGAVRRPE